MCLFSLSLLQCIMGLPSPASNTCDTCLRLSKQSIVEGSFILEWPSHWVHNNVALNCWLCRQLTRHWNRASSSSIVYYQYKRETFKLWYCKEEIKLENHMLRGPNTSHNPLFQPSVISFSLQMLGADGPCQAKLEIQWSRGKGCNDSSQDWPH